jgi:hypothetical protein
MFVRTYAPGRTIASFWGQLLTGFGDEIVTCKRTEDVFETVVGADGEVARRQSSNKTGEVQVTVKQTSAANAILSSLLRADELSGVSGVGPLLVKDNTGTTMWSGDGWLKGWPEVKRSKDAVDHVWTIACSRLEFEFPALPTNV